MEQVFSLLLSDCLKKSIRECLLISVDSFSEFSDIGPGYSHDIF